MVGSPSYVHWWVALNATTLTTISLGPLPLFQYTFFFPDARPGEVSYVFDGNYGLEGQPLYAPQERETDEAGAVATA